MKTLEAEVVIACDIQYVPLVVDSWTFLYFEVPNDDSRLHWLEFGRGPSGPYSERGANVPL